MQFSTIANQPSRNDTEIRAVDRSLEIEPKTLSYFAEKISFDKKCRYPQLVLRILIHVVATTDTDGKIYISARRLSQAMNAHYDTVTKCIKYLREIEVLKKGQ